MLSDPITKAGGRFCVYSFTTETPVLTPMLSLFFGLMLAVFLVGCATPAQTAGVIGGSIFGGALVGAYSPGHELEQVYYLGVFDPQEQLPPEVYRLTVRGQSAAFSTMKFGSGWVPASLIDSLSGHVRIDPNATDGSGISFSKDDATSVALQSRRRLIQFGPEGMREAPKDHRLVIVMGSSPKGFFDAVDSAMGSLSAMQSDRGNLLLDRDILKVLRDLESEKSKWREFTKTNQGLLQ